ncbi:MAG: LacI family DNA-binding transcriptional regulator [Firmicutes bacterium]|nr:LacI family DNA-binding transcriptional regulator [Bacillota bacterium]
MATIRDVARLARVSTTTVSRVLNRDATLAVAQETRQRVIEAAERLSYRSPARGVTTRQLAGLHVGIVVFSGEDDEAFDPFYLSIREGVYKECERWGMPNPQMVRCGRHDAQSQLAELDALVAICDDSRWLKNISTWPERTVFVDYCPDPDRYDSVVLDYMQGTRKVIEHLVGLGHQRIGFLGGPLYGVHGEPVEDGRLFAFRTLMMRAGLYDERFEMGTDSWGTDAAYRAVADALAHAALPTALFVASDPMAIATIRALVDAGLRVPEDVAVVGFDDIRLAQFVTPSLTTVKVYPEAMGMAAVRLLQDRFEGRELPMRVSLPCTLVVRESSGAAVEHGRDPQGAFAADVGTGV